MCHLAVKRGKTRVKPESENRFHFRKRSTTRCNTPRLSIFVNLVFDARRVRLSVRDDGRGFDIQATGNGPSGHLGLVGMLERAEQIRGTLSIHRGEGLGAEIVVDVPISG
jgi:signal transduction histidine kinase